MVRGVILLFILLLGFSDRAFTYGKLPNPDAGKVLKVENPGSFQMTADRFYEYTGVEGPLHTTQVPKEVPTPWEKYSSGEDSRLAILLTDTNSEWISLVQGLKSIGIPFVITMDYKKALQHKVVLVYPAVGGKTLSPWAYRELMAFPDRGGTLIGINVESNNMNDIFGFDNAVPTSRNTSLNFKRTDSPLLSSFTDSKEMTIMLGDVTSKEPNYGTCSYTHPRHAPLAVFNNGEAAITEERHGRGVAYAWGIDIGGFLSDGYNDRGELYAQSYINEYQPSADVLLRLLKEMYAAGEEDGVTIGSVPYNKNLSVLFSHDVDANTSYKNAVTYAEYEKSVGIKGTYFIQTKYIKDWNDEAIFTKEAIADLKKVHALGMEIGSHTVAHSKVFAEAPLGTGNEKYPDYQPFVLDRYTVQNFTVLGELRVSKFLLEELGITDKVISFRPGELANPKTLAQALQATGYKYSSTLTANSALTHLPFRLNYGKGDVGESEVFEFPLTLEDELPPALLNRVEDGIELGKKIGKYGGIYVVLIHPNITGVKLEYEKGLVEGLKLQDAWFPTVGQLGDWWSARDKVQIDVRKEKGLRRLDVIAPLPVEGLTLKVPTTWRLQNAGTLEVEQEEGVIIIKRAEGKMELDFSMTS